MSEFIVVSDMETCFDVFLNVSSIERFEDYPVQTGSVIALCSGEILRVSETCETIMNKIREASHV